MKIEEGNREVSREEITIVYKEVFATDLRGSRGFKKGFYRDEGDERDAEIFFIPFIPVKTVF